MKPPIEVLLCCLLVPSAFAQHHGGGGSAGHAGRPGIHHGGSIWNFGPRGYGWYGYGGLYDDFYGPSYDSGYYPAPEPPPPSVPMFYPPAAPPVTPQPVHSVIHEYGPPESYAPAAPAAAQESGPILYLIAFRDKNIRAAMTYWVEDGTLHYLDTDHTEQHAPLTSVDRDLSVQLNHERRVPFNIP
jgi:hypothetical protein